MDEKVGHRQSRTHMTWLGLHMLNGRQQPSIVRPPQMPPWLFKELIVASLHHESTHIIPLLWRRHNHVRHLLRSTKFTVAQSKKPFQRRSLQNK